MKKYTNIPISLCEFALTNRKLNQTRIFILLKLESDGYVENYEKFEEDIANKLNLNIKTIRNSIKWLIDQKWITVNSKQNKYHIISYERLSKKINSEFKSGFSFEFDYLDNFKVLCIAIVITYYLNKKRFFNGRSGNKRGFPTMNRKLKKGFYPMANGYLAKCLGVSIATACRYKQLADKHGYIEVIPQIIYITEESGKPISSEHYDVFKLIDDKYDRPNSLRKGKKYLKRVYSDAIKSNIQTKRKAFYINGKK